VFVQNLKGLSHGNKAYYAKHQSIGLPARISRHTRNQSFIKETVITEHLKIALKVLQVYFKEKRTYVVQRTFKRKVSSSQLYQPKILPYINILKGNVQ
jgi:hypothetical protein